MPLLSAAIEQAYGRGPLRKVPMPVCVCVSVEAGAGAGARLLSIIEPLNWQGADYLAVDV